MAMTTGQKVGTSMVAGGGLAGGLLGLLGGGGNNPADAAMPYYNQIPGQIKPLYQPYVDAGTNALPGYQDILKKMMSNPDELIKQFGQGYQKSPGYDWNVNQAQQGVNNQMAAGGMLGTPQGQQLSAEALSGIASKDYGNYMDRIMSLFGGGVEGQGGLVKQGADSSSRLADSLASVLAQQGGLAYKGQEGENEAKASSMNSLGQGLGALGSLLML